MHKRNDNKHDEHVHDESKLRHKVHKHNYKKEQLGLICYGAIGVFMNGVLRTIDNDKEFISDDIIVGEVKILNDDVIRAIKNEEANAAADASAKNEHVAGA